MDLASQWGAAICDEARAITHGHAVQAHGDAAHHRQGAGPSPQPRAGTGTASLTYIKINT